MLGFIGVMVMLAGVIGMVGVVLANPALLMLAIFAGLVELGNLMLTAWLAQHEAERL